MIKRIVKLTLMVAAMALATSCSNSKMEKLLDLVPANSEAVMLCDVETLVKSADGSIKDCRIKLPSSIENDIPSFMSRDIDKFNEMTHEAGINPEAICMVVNGKYMDYRELYIVKLDDKKKLTAYLEDNSFREKDEEDGITLYVKKEENSWGSSENTYVAIKDSYIYYLPYVYAYEDMDFNPERSIKKFIEAAGEESIGKTKAAKYVAGGSVGGFIAHVDKKILNQAGSVPSEVKKLVDGYFCMRANLDGNALTLTAKMFDEDGKEKNFDDFGNLMNMDAKIDKEALTYLGKNENMVMALSLKDVKWNKIIDRIADEGYLSRREVAMMDEVKKYLQKLDGTVAVGFGLTNGINSITDLDKGYKPMEAMSFTMVAQCKEKQPKAIVEEVKTMLTNVNLPFKSTSAGINVTMDDMSFYMEAKGNYLVVSNRKISQGVNEAVKAINFSDYITAGAIVLSKNNKLMSDLGIDNDVVATYTADPKKCELNFKAEIEGGKAKGFVGKLFEMIITISSNHKAIEKKVQNRVEKIDSERYGIYYNDSYGYEDYAVAEAEPDYVWEDSVAVEAW